MILILFNVIYGTYVLYATVPWQQYQKWYWMLTNYKSCQLGINLTVDRWVIPMWSYVYWKSYYDRLRIDKASQCQRTTTGHHVSSSRLATLPTNHHTSVAGSLKSRLAIYVYSQCHLQLHRLLPWILVGSINDWLPIVDVQSFSSYGRCPAY